MSCGEVVVAMVKPCPMPALPLNRGSSVRARCPASPAARTVSRRSRPSSGRDSGTGGSRRPRSAASCRSAQSNGRSSPPSRGRARIRSTRPWLNTASSSPSTWATLTAARLHMPSLRSCRAGAEGPGAVQEMAVHGTDARLAAGRDRGDAEHLHPGEQRDQGPCRQRAVVVDDLAQVVGRGSVRGVQQLLQGGDLLGGLQHHFTIGRAPRACLLEQVGLRWMR